MFSKKSKKEIKITGMHCEKCADNIRKCLLNLENVDAVKVNLKKSLAILKFHEKISNDVISENIESLGFKVVEIK